MIDLEKDAYLRLPDVMRLTTLSSSEIYRQIQAGTFPKQIRLSHKRAVWRAADVRGWLEAPRVAA